MTKFVTYLLDLIFPPTCIYCNKPLPSSLHHACDDCKQTQAFLPANTASLMGQHFTACHSVALYEGAIRQAMLDFKFHQKRHHVVSFSIALSQIITLHYKDDYDAITWVPTSAKTLKTRGYDQSYLLAKSVAKQVGKPLIKTLKTSNAKKAQSSLASPSERQSNIKNMFCVLPSAKVKDKRILLIDDVVTTGATLNEVAYHLKTAGASCVLCAAFCRST